MAETTGISWVDRTWSPWLGCQKVGPACDHCYAEAWAKRYGRVEWGPHAERVKTSKPYWQRLRKWNAEAEAAGVRLSVFPSLCDPFDNAADPDWRREFFAAMRACPWLDFLLLTKRPGNAIKMVRDAGGWPPNAWLGGTIVTPAELARDMSALADAKQLFDIPVLFLSMEPLLEGVEIPAWMLKIIDWVIVGGESGAHARPLHPDWVRNIRDACRQAGVLFHFKQWGEWTSVYDRDRDDPDWRRCPPDSRQDGRYINLAGGHGFHGERVHYLRRLGTKKTGRLLDGQLHDARPRIAA